VAKRLSLDRLEGVVYRKEPEPAAVLDGEESMPEVDDDPSKPRRKMELVHFRNVPAPEELAKNRPRPFNILVDEVKTTRGKFQLRLYGLEKGNVTVFRVSGIVGKDTIKFETFKTNRWSWVDELRSVRIAVRPPQSSPEAELDLTKLVQGVPLEEAVRRKNAQKFAQALQAAGVGDGNQEVQLAAAKAEAEAKARIGVEEKVRREQLSLRRDEGGIERTMMMRTRKEDAEKLVVDQARSGGLSDRTGNPMLGDLPGALPEHSRLGTAKPGAGADTSEMGRGGALPKTKAPITPNVPIGQVAAADPSQIPAQAPVLAPGEGAIFGPGVIGAPLPAVAAGAGAPGVVMVPGATGPGVPGAPGPGLAPAVAGQAALLGSTIPGTPGAAPGAPGAPATGAPGGAVGPAALPNSAANPAGKAGTSPSLPAPTGSTSASTAADAAAAKGDSPLPGETHGLAGKVAAKKRAPTALELALQVHVRGRKAPPVADSAEKAESELSVLDGPEFVVEVDPEHGSTGPSKPMRFRVGDRGLSIEA
jgi:hypothetical protein